MVRLVIFDLVGTICDHGATFARRALTRAAQQSACSTPHGPLSRILAMHAAQRGAPFPGAPAPPPHLPLVAPPLTAPPPPAGHPYLLSSNYDPRLATEFLTREDVRRAMDPQPPHTAPTLMVPPTPLTPTQLNDLYRRYRQEHRNLLLRDPHVLHSQAPRVFQELRERGVMLGAVSRYPRVWYRIVQRLAFQKGMGFGVTGCRDPLTRDSPLEQALTTARQGDPISSYYVGDNVEGLREAKRHGLRTIAVIDSSRYMGCTEKDFNDAMYDEVEQRRDDIVDRYLTGRAMDIERDHYDVLEHGRNRTVDQYLSASVSDIIVPNIACVPLVLRAEVAIAAEKAGKTGSH